MKAKISLYLSIFSTAVSITALVISLKVNKEVREIEQFEKAQTKFDSMVTSEIIHSIVNEP